MDGWRGLWVWYMVDLAYMSGWKQRISDLTSPSLLPFPFIHSSTPSRTPFPPLPCEKFFAVRIVPDLDIPGHSSGWWPARINGMQFCDNNSADQSFHQLYDDAAGRTRAVLRAYLEEILPLFPDSHFFLMGDETHAVAPCSLDNIAGLERAMRGS